jgi:ABC-type Na+ efflux pump permease subunit/membrane protease YdiL (CAAX protease family)
MSDSPARRVGGLRLRRLALKELRETLRDRRTIITLFAMPLLVYPILSLIFRTFLFSTLMSGTSDEPVKFNYMVESELDDEKLMAIREQLFKVTEMFLNPNQEAGQETDEVSDASKTNADEEVQLSVPGLPKPGPEIASFLEHDWTRYALDPENPVSLEDLIRKGEADVGLRINVRKGERRGFGYKVEIIQNESRANSRSATRVLKERLDVFNREGLRQRLKILRVRTDVAFQMEEQKVESSEPQKQPLSFAALIPLMLVLMTITGAVYPAIDLTAGERERGTLETLVAAPIPRISILMSKFIAVLTVAVLTATLNVAGILVTIWAFQLESMLGGGGLTWPMIAKVFALLILFAGFFSALLLAVTSYARSFKEAQAYLIPIILLSLAPGLMALTPGLSLNGPLAVAPMVNILLLARDVLEGQAELVPAMIAVLSTVLYGFVAILVAAKIFGTDAILYGSSGSWKDLFVRPTEPIDRVPTPTVITCLALLFPANFVLIGYLGRFQGPLATRLMLMGLFTFLTFMAFPYLVSAFQRVKVSSGFGFRMPRISFILLAVVLGCSLWPMVMSIITGWQYVLEFFQGAVESQAWHDRLIEFGKAQAASLREINPAIIAVTFAFLPALCEEWFFRGFLLRSLLKDRPVWLAITISAVVFGLFHVLSNSVVAMDRLLPTTLVGIVLGWLCYRSGSIIPGILMHMLHNGIVVFLAYYQPQLSEYAWFPAEGAAIPVSWIGVSALVSLACVFALQLLPRQSFDEAN